MPSSCESILEATVESVQGNLVYIEWIWISGHFGMVARPLELLSIFKWRPPPLEVHQERRDAFPEKSGHWTLM